MKGLIYLLLIICTTAYGQMSDTAFHKVEGKVIDKINKEEVQNAKITYESLPFASNIGFRKGGQFAFFIPREEQYRIKVTAQGYSPYFHEIKKEEFNNGTYNTIVELVPNDLNRLIRLEKLIFALGRANITPESYEELNTIVSMMESNPEMVIQLEGHTDFRGNAKANMKLSEKRVEAVKDYLEAHGIDKKRIKLKAFGGTQPLSRSNDPDSHAMNRRVEVRIIEN